MKKVLKVLSAAMLSAVVAAGASASVFAATGVNAAEQRVLDELKTTVTMAGQEKSLPVRYINQAENYFANECDMTEAQADEVIEKIEAAKAYLTSTGKPNYNSLSDSEINQMVALSKAAAAVVDCTIEYEKSGRNVNVIKKGTTSDTSKPGGTTSNPGSSGTQSGSKTIISGSSTGKDDTIKTTGFGVPGAASVAGVGILAAAAAGAYLIASKKKETVDA